MFTFAVLCLDNDKIVYLMISAFDARVGVFYVLTLEALKYFRINHGNQMVFPIEIIINVLVGCFRFN